MTDTPKPLSPEERESWHRIAHNYSGDERASPPPRLADGGRMANVTTCTRCHRAFEAASEEEANEQDRYCEHCIEHECPRCKKPTRNRMVCDECARKIATNIGRDGKKVDHGGPSH